MSKQESSLNYSVSAGIWFAVATSIMFSRESPELDVWWLGFLMLFVSMFLYSVSFYALGKAVSQRITEDRETRRFE